MFSPCLSNASLFLELGRRRSRPGNAGCWQSRRMIRTSNPIPFLRGPAWVRFFQSSNAVKRSIRLYFCRMRKYEVSTPSLLLPPAGRDAPRPSRPGAGSLRAADVPRSTSWRAGTRDSSGGEPPLPRAAGVGPAPAAVLRPSRPGAGASPPPAFAAGSASPILREAGPGRGAPPPPRAAGVGPAPAAALRARPVLPLLRPRPCRAPSRSGRTSRSWTCASWPRSRP